MMNFRDGYEANKELLDMKPTSNPELFVLKYKRKVFYNSQWNDFLEECRGTIVDADFNVVSLPFRKIYNYGREKEAPVWTDDTPVKFFRKVNGFMVAITWHDGKLLVSTTGSIDSDFVGYANEFINKNREGYELLAKLNAKETFLFECCHPLDPHIVDEEAGMYLLGARSKIDGFLNVGGVMQNYVFAKETGYFLPEMSQGTFGNVQKLVKDVKHEGFVIYAEDGTAAKIKSPHYLIKKLFMRGNLEKLANKKIRETIDEEYYGLCDAVYAIRDTFALMSEADRKVFIEDYFQRNGK